ncbi:MAG TPA: hypothetical protein VKA46_35885 [Gemmataceae bacterium]|nr:hypothetical protein [Gemmataceae bacterium]
MILPDASSMRARLQHVENGVPKGSFLLLCEVILLDLLGLRLPLGHDESGRAAVLLLLDHHLGNVDLLSVAETPALPLRF